MGEAVTEVAVAISEPKRRSLLVELAVRMVKEKPLGTVGAVIVLVLLLTGIFAELLAPYGYNQMFLESRLALPGPKFPLGADHLGRDMLSRIIFGARIAMFVGFGASLTSLFMKVIIGTISGYLGGRVDTIIQRFVDAWMCIPGLFILLTVMSILGPGVIQMIIVLGPFMGIGASRVIRSAVIGIKENVYVEASRAVGAPMSRILLRHIIPNIMPVIIITLSVQLGGIILTASTLSFLGFGIPPPVPDWGAMLSESGRRFLLLAPWMALWPGLALSIVVYGFNMFGDALRDLLDPRLRGGLGRYAGTKVSGSVVASQAKK